MKRILSIFLILILCLSICVPIAFAEGDTFDRDYGGGGSGGGGGGGSTMDGTEVPGEETDTLKEWWNIYVYEIFAGGLLGQIFGNDTPQLPDKIIELFQVIYDIISEIKDKFNGNMMSPVIEFVDNLSETAVALFAPFWDFPIIKDLLILSVTLGVLGMFIFMFVKR